MEKDTRITVGLALIYFLNGFFGFFGDAKTFLPLYIFDPFLLFSITLLFGLLPPFNRFFWIHLGFSASFLIQGMGAIGMIQSTNLQVANLVVFITGCLCMMLWTFRLTRFRNIPIAIILASYIASLVEGFIGTPGLCIILTMLPSMILAIYLLAKPPWQESSAVIKRFYLMLALGIFFDLLFQVFVLYSRQSFNG